MTDDTVDELIQPQGRGYRDEEQRNLDSNREHQHNIVNAIDGAASANSFEGLPSERLGDRSVSSAYKCLNRKKIHLDEPPRQDHRPQQSNAIQGQTGDLRVGSRLPVRRQQVHMARASGSKAGKGVVELGSVVLPGRTVRSWYV